MVTKRTLAIVAAVCVAAVVVIVPCVLLLPHTAQFKATFLQRCEHFWPRSHNCTDTWTTFQEAYEGQDKCTVTELNYLLLYLKYKFDHPCSSTMFWSGTEHLKKYASFSSYTTLEDTLFATVLNGLEWCGKSGSKGTYVYLCKDCEPNPVSSFWKAANIMFAQDACGVVSVILDGAKEEPYDPNSVFGSVVVPSLPVGRVSTLHVFLIKEQWGFCDCGALGTLRQDLDERIACECQEVSPQYYK